MPITRALLTPASLIWTWITARRLARATPYDCGVPVICVGNLTVGGSGKTPVVLALIARMPLDGQRPHILSRGYGGRLKGPVRVDPRVHRAIDVGDEALMMAARAPTWVARDRVAGAIAAAAGGAGMIVMDDGHQNSSLLKNLSLIVVDGETRDNEWPFGDGAVFPAGPMREPLDAGLRRANAVVIVLPADIDGPAPDLVTLFDGKPILVARLAPTEKPPAGPQIGFAGIAKPWKLERALKAAGCDLIDFAPLADHAAISEGTLRFLARRAEAFGAGLITTEKDWARLSTAWRDRVVAWPVRVEFDDPAALATLIGQACEFIATPTEDTSP